MSKAPILDLKKLPEKEALAAIRQIYGWAEDDARFYLAIVKGEIDGDIVDEGSPKLETARKAASNIARSKKK